MAEIEPPWAGFEALLCALAKRAGSRPTVERLCATPWSRKSGSGGRCSYAHWLEGQGCGGRATTMARELDYAEFDLRDHILADILVANQKVSQARAKIEIEALILTNE